MESSELILSLIFVVYQLFPCFDCSGFGQDMRWDRAAPVKYDTTCPTDCSQGPRISGDDSYFNCTVGNLSEVEKFKASFAVKMKNAKIHFDPPKLLNIEFYHKPFSADQYEAALNITFQLPKGKPTGLLEMKMTNAIFLYFQSIDDQEFGDDFYYKNPRERIFRFWNYENYEPPFFDADYPRNISYDCMVGLNDSKPRRVYIITLESAFGGSITYNCTVWVNQGNNHIRAWLPTIATSLNTTNKSVQVVFGKFPWKQSDSWEDQAKKVIYNVSLLGSDRRVYQYKKLNQEEHDIVFSDLKHEKYFVNVTKCEETYDFDINKEIRRNCVSAESYIIDATGIPKEVHATPITYTVDHDTLYMALAVSLGCLIGVTLVAALVLIFLRTRKKPPSRSSSFEETEKPAGIILSRSTVHQNVIKKFALYLQNICGWVVYADILESNRNELEQPERWFSDKLEKSSFVIIVCSKEHFLESDSFYNMAISKALEKRNSSNTIRIVPITFSLSPDETIPRELSCYSVFNLMEEMESFYCKIHSKTKHFHSSIDFKQYHTSKEGNNLKLALASARLNTQANVSLDFKDTVTKLKEENVDKSNNYLLDCVEDMPKIEDIKRKLEDMNMSQSSINTFASECNEPGLDSESDTPEHEPLLENRHPGVKMNPGQSAIGNEEPIHLLVRQRHNSEGYPSQRIQHFIDENPADHFGHRNDNQTSYRPEGHILDNPYEHHISPKYRPSLHYTQNTVADSEQRYQQNVHPEFHRSFSEHDYTYQNQRNPCVIHRADVHNAHHLCPRHGGKEYDHSPDFHKRYMCSMNEYEGIYDEYNNRAYHSFPQDYYEYDVYETRQNHDLFLPTPVRHMPIIEFAAVDPKERRTASQEKDDVQFDSGYKSNGLGAPQRLLTDNGSESRATEDQETEIFFVNQTSNKLKHDDDKRTEETNHREGEITSTGRYSYPLSLSVKRDFHCDMFIPPEDLESCLSEQGGGSSTDIMDQLAEINVKNKD